MKRTGFAAAAAALWLCLAVFGAARAQDRTIHVIVPLLAGAATDVVTRTFVAALSQRLGQPIVVENKAGGATTLGTHYVVKSAPDGLTLLSATTSTLSVLPNVQKPPFDTQKDLVPIVAFSVSPFVFGVAAESKYMTLAELIAAAKANPGKLTFGSSGTGTLTHMVVELLSVVAQANFTHVPYKGVTGAYADVIGGRVDFLADGPASMLPQVRGNRVRALVVTAPQRLPTLPNVPTVVELGMPGAEADFTGGLLAPAGTPAAVLARYEAAALQVAQSQAFKDYLATQGYEALAADASQFGKIIRDGLAKWERVVRERKIKVE
ncbi:MAG: tripartite tricarboxylate transporter substrate binding protein [Betaproteobacteria bacterium]|nr:tripartite tricarboxylate transporter substrate binding protein [Betaproteobacteria bacterium]